jgi:hypothetical protein
VAAVGPIAGHHNRGSCRRKGAGAPRRHKTLAAQLCALMKTPQAHFAPNVTIVLGGGGGT